MSLTSLAGGESRENLPLLRWVETPSFRQSPQSSRPPQSSMSPPTSPPLIWHIDRPAHRPVADQFIVRGWAAGATEITGIEPESGRFLDFSWEHRPDLVPPPSGAAWAGGFVARATPDCLQGDRLRCRLTLGGDSQVLEWPFPRAVDPERKERKLRAIRSELLKDTPVRETKDFLSFLPADFPLEEPIAASGYGYPPAIEELIAAHPKGWMLDCGAGDRPTYLDRVVNLEVAAFPSTDVIADGESLPFRDASFDAVFSLAVLEHIRRPWVAARELVRVLKPGGTLRVDVPFLQPVHGYPEHFFNMTSEGLCSLFSDSCEIVATEVPRYGRPVYTLSWFLQRYVDGLPETERSRFLDRRVRDLIRPVESQLAESYVSELPPASEFELASVTTVLARKR